MDHELARWLSSEEGTLVSIEPLCTNRLLEWVKIRGKREREREVKPEGKELELRMGRLCIYERSILKRADACLQKTFSHVQVTLRVWGRLNKALADISLPMDGKGQPRCM